MTAQVVSIVGVVLASSVALTIVVLPTAAWRDAAEHSKQFWGSCVLGFVTAGVVAPAAAGIGWATGAWLLACCAFAVLQPSLLADLREVRAHARRTKHPRGPVPPSRLVSMDDLPPIRWRAPSA